MNTFLVIDDKVINVQAQPVWRVQNGVLEVFTDPGRAPICYRFSVEVTPIQFANCLAAVSRMGRAFTGEDLEDHLRFMYPDLSKAK